jgi:CheY-like chemotaxis protein
MVGRGRFLREAGKGKPKKMPRPLEVFIVEDDPAGCMELEDLLRSIGHSVAARADSVDGAFSSLARLKNIGIVPDVAVINANWNEAAAHRVVLALRTRGIPVVVDAGTTGVEMPPSWNVEYYGTLFGKDRIREALDTISRFGQTRSRPVAVI